MLKVRYGSRFKKDYKAIVRCGYNPKLLEDVLTILIDVQPLPQKYKDHALTGNYKGYRECHISPDWLLIYKVDDDIITLTLVKTGTHSDLF